MKVILKEEVQGLGSQYDVVDVKPGYARNYLMPRNIAIAASESNIKMVNEIRKQQSLKLAKLKDDAQSLANAIGDIMLVIKAKAGESGKIFGAVTPLQIADVLRARGFDVDRRKITLNEDVKNVGDYTAQINLHKDVKHKIRFTVTAE
ncbi:MAG: 50S ribosomal protein L9 [Cytophagales bacterium]|nr:MAG: 50S ribosomal protein L9 [Cytophagales bacterium]TAF61942.1 MAG: 50S ribosomal protein L9 [Cytophagales bacterium]